AGTGAVGIEALSRGAAQASFVDSSPRAIATIRETLRRTRLAERADVIRADVRRALARFEQGFDIVFMDPPYEIEHGDLDADVRAAGAPEVLRPGGLLILTRPAKGYMPVIPV